MVHLTENNELMERLWRKQLDFSTAKSVRMKEYRSKQKQLVILRLYFEYRKISNQSFPFFSPWLSQVLIFSFYNFRFQSNCCFSTECAEEDYVVFSEVFKVRITQNAVYKTIHLTVFNWQYFSMHVQNIVGQNKFTKAPTSLSFFCQKTFLWTSELSFECLTVAAVVFNRVVD